MDLMKAREKFAEINLKQGFYTQEELEFTDLGVFECAAAEQDFDMWWECLIYYAQPLVDQKEKALLEQFEINNKLVEQIEKLKAKAQAIPDGFVVVPKEPTQELLNKMQDFFVGAFENGLTGGQSMHCAYIAMIEAQEQSND